RGGRAPAQPGTRRTADDLRQSIPNRAFAESRARHGSDPPVRRARDGAEDPYRSPTGLNERVMAVFLNARLRTAKLPGLRMAYRTFGSLGSRWPIILCHGFP